MFKNKNLENNTLTKLKHKSYLLKIINLLIKVIIFIRLRLEYIVINVIHIYQY